MTLPLPDRSSKTEIEAMVLAISGLEAELAEIDENIVRNELTTLERAE
jgi:hypothetical protein